MRESFEIEHQLHLRKARKTIVNDTQKSLLQEKPNMNTGDLKQRIKTNLKINCEDFEDHNNSQMFLLKTDVITFDLQKVFSIPKLTTAEIYHSHQLSTYNLGIHSLTRKLSIMNVWHEGEASRGPEEIGSCILEYCKNITKEAFKSLIAFSDACGGQNRNYKIATFWIYMTATTEIEEVEQKFMTSGHSFLPNDRDFGIIEQKSRKANPLLYSRRLL